MEKGGQEETEEKRTPQACLPAILRVWMDGTCYALFRNISSCFRIHKFKVLDTRLVTFSVCCYLNFTTRTKFHPISVWAAQDQYGSSAERIIQIQDHRTSWYRPAVLAFAFLGLPSFLLLNAVTRNWVHKWLYVFTYVVTVSKPHSYIVSNIKIVCEKLIGNQLEGIGLALVWVTDQEDGRRGWENLCKIS
jgi:hypothetical protein